MEGIERNVPTLIDRKTEKTRHRLTMDITGCEDAARAYLESLGVEFKIDGDRHTAMITLDTENEAEKAALDRLITDAGVGKNVGGYGIVRALAFPLEFHEEVEEADYGKVATATTVQIGGKKKRDTSLWLWEYLLPVLLAIIVGVGYAGLATHQRNMETYTSVSVEQLRGDWYRQYVNVSGLSAWLHPVTNRFTVNFPIDSIITETKRFALLKIETDTILVVGPTDGAKGTWYPKEMQFVGEGDSLVTFVQPDSADINKYSENTVDPMTIEYNKVDKIRKFFEEGRRKKDVQLSGVVLFEDDDFYMPVKKGRMKLIPQNELQKLYLGAAREATVMGRMRFYKWINEENPNRSRRETQIVGEFDLEMVQIWGKYL